MTDAALFVEAIHTAYRLGWALLVWIALTAATITLALYAAAVIVWNVCRTVWKTARRDSGGPLWARGRLRARIFARTHARGPRRRTAPWMHSQPLDRDYEECA